MDPLLNSFTGMFHDGAHVAYSGTANYTYNTKDQVPQESST